jgi:adenylate kinase
MLRKHSGLKDGIGQRAEQLIKAGRLVPDDLVNNLVEERLCEQDAKSGVILDGYPRTINQADVLLKLLQRCRYRPAVIHLMVDHEKVVARLSGRRQCPVCGTLYSLTTNPPRVPGVCDLDGAALVTREDDRESVIRERLLEYDRQTVPILEFFREVTVPIFKIQAGDTSPEQILEEVRRALGESGFLSADEGCSEPGAVDRKSITR